MFRLILATPDSEDPVTLTQAAARDHIPLDPKRQVSEEILAQVPESKHRPTVEETVSDLRQASWYKDQILYHRVFEAHEPRIGIHPPTGVSSHVHLIICA
jgi:DEAD/DEAH box helicase domain-containing protein